ncbi:unnamed protein product, partial [Prorocentrum cordatum]
ATGPPCMRCCRPSGEDAERLFVVVSQRSIFTPDCPHGPYCGSCVAKMQRLTLPLCLGCNALVQRFEAELGAGRQAGSLSRELAAPCELSAPSPGAAAAPPDVAADAAAGADSAASAPAPAAAGAAAGPAGAAADPSSADRPGTGGRAAGSTVASAAGAALPEVGHFDRLD